MAMAPSEVQRDQPAYSCRACYCRRFILVVIPTALLCLQSLDYFLHELPHVELGLVEIGNIRCAESVERLLKRKDRFACVALVELVFKYWDARADQAVLNVRLGPRADQGTRAVQEYGIGLGFAGHLCA